MGTGEEVKVVLECFIHGWSFMAVDAIGRYGGLAIGWNSPKFQVLNTWGLDSGLGITFLLHELNETTNLLNIYRPYLKRKYFWDTLLKIPCLRIY
jgi:hypothetical protein